LSNRQAVHAWKTEIENGGGIGFGVAKKPAFLTIGFNVDDETRRLECGGDILADPLIVFD
jgi:hypothetical protein